MVNEEVQRLMNAMPNTFVSSSGAGLDVTIQYRLVGEGGGDWLVRIADGACTVTQGSAADAKLTLTLSVEDFLELTAGRLNPMNAFMTGKLKLDGDMMFAAKFATMFKVNNA